MRTIDLPLPAGRLSGPTLALALAAAFLHSALSMPCAAQTRTDNRRLFFTGSNGAVWDHSAASWKTTGTYLTYANSGTDAGFVHETWAVTTALPATPFLAGDVAIFDSASDLVPVYDADSDTWITPPSDGLRTITIASAGVTASDVVVSGSGRHVFTGGAITADPAAIAPGSLQLTGTGVGLAAGAVLPTGRLVKYGDGTLILSNTAAHRFAGGIHLVDGTLSITDKRALGDNNIITQYYSPSGRVEASLGNIIEAELLQQIMGHNTPVGGIYLPATVLNADGQLLTSSTRTLAPSLHVAASAAGLDITGNLYIGSLIVTLDIEGDTTISGHIYGRISDYGANGGTLIKNGPGTLTLTGTRNWFHGASRNYNQLNAGRIVATTPYAIGTGAWSLNGGILEFRGVQGTMRQAFIGGGAIEITGGSDLTFDWRNGTLDRFDDLSGLTSWHPAMNELSAITVSGQSRFTAMASGTYSTVLGGANAFVTISEGSTLVLGREGLSARGSGSTDIPMTYAILANRVELTGGSTLVLNPNAYLNTGALVFTDTTTTCAITFGASGVSRLRWQEGINPESIALDPAAASAAVRYIVPDGMELIINDINVPVPDQDSSPADGTSKGYCREYVLVNQGANPLQDIAMTLNALDALHDTLSTRLADELISPVIRHAPARKRKWVNEAWMRYITSEVDYDARSITTPGVTGRINGAILGLDWLLPDNLLLGIHGGIADNNLDTTNHTSLSSKQKFLGIHAAQLFGKAYLSASADTGRASTDSFRYEIGNLTRGKWDTSYYSGAVEAGATFNPWEKLLLRPYASLRYSKLKLTGHYERGLSPLVIGNFDDASAQTTYGVVAGYQFKLLKRDLALDLSLARKHVIRSPRETLNTRYFDSPNTPVTLRRGDFYANATAFGLSARAAITRHTLAGLAFDYETASSYNRLTGSFLIGCTW